MKASAETSVANTIPPSPSEYHFTLGLRGRLFLGFGAILLLLIISISIVLVKTTTSEKIADQVMSQDLPVYDLFNSLYNNIELSIASTTSYLLKPTDEFKKSYETAWLRIEDVKTHLNDYARNWDQAHQLQWEKVKAALDELQSTENTMHTSPDAAMIDVLVAKLANAQEKLLLSLDGELLKSGERRGGILDRQHEVMKQGSFEVTQSMATIKNTQYALLAIAIVLSLFITYYTSRGIFYYLKNFRNHSSKIAMGDLRHRLPIHSRDEMALLGKDLNIMTDNLASMTKNIAHACHNMVSTIEEVRQSVQVQSSGATEQATSVTEITASLAEIEKSSAQTTEKSKALNSIADKTREQGMKGLKAVQDSIHGMRSVRDKVQDIAQTILALSNQTQQVGEITTVVNSLAQQSKMLALNASIEAAKAGEAGKGFAVVATEVRNLAEQSEESTTQVQKILEEIRIATEKAVLVTEEGTKGVDRGTDLVEETGKVIRDLSEVINETMMATQQIEAAISQESVGIEQITIGMNEINQVTGSFVDSVKQTTEAIDNLAVIANDLKRIIDQYQV